MDKHAYRVGEAARLISISRSKLYELIGAGLVPTHKLGRITLVLHDDLMRLFSRGKNPPPTSDA